MAHRETVPGLRAMRRRVLHWALGVLAALGPGACDQQPGRPARGQQDLRAEWQYLFDGKTLTGWKTPEWGGSGKVYVKDGALHMETGAMLTGATYTGKIPREDYELALEAKRVADFDFFCGLTFPVGKDVISLVLGGWGGTTVGLSSLDYQDASQNETSQFFEFETNRWYRVRVRVTRAEIRCFLDDKQIIAVRRAGRKIDIRPEMDLSVPLGVATWRTHGTARNIRIRRLGEAERTAP